MQQGTRAEKTLLGHNSSLRTWEGVAESLRGSSFPNLELGSVNKDQEADRSTGLG